MSESPGRLRRFFRAVGRLHFGLYFIFSMMLALGGIVASIFEQYSVVDLKGGLAVMQERAAEGSRARSTAAHRERLRTAFKPLDEQSRAEARRVREAKDSNVHLRLGPRSGSVLYALLIVWLWPLYRHYFARRKPDAATVARRIVDLPVFLFALTWVAAAMRGFDQWLLYEELNGVADLRVKTTFFAAALLLGAFAGYLNLELTQIYVRRRIARPYFEAADPHGLKHGLRVGLTMRYGLMLFSLAAAPLALCVYLPAYFNWDLLRALRDTPGEKLFLANTGILFPLLMTAFIVGLMFCFHLLSMLLFRWNVQLPLTGLVSRMRRVAAGDFENKLPVLDSDEISQLKGHFNLMLDGLKERERIKDTFGRYVSIEIAKKIIESGKGHLAGEEIEAAVLFSDIRNFTPLSESLTPTELIQFLNAYFGHITVPIMANGGVINKFIGDAVMAIFSPALGQKDYAAAAIRAACGMREALAEFNRSGEFAPVHAGIGVHCGPLIAGNVGTEQRTEYTVLGDTVNVAARIESATKEQGTDILVSAALIAELRAEDSAGWEFVSCGPILLKGKSAALELYRVTSLPGATDAGEGRTDEVSS